MKKFGSASCALALGLGSVLVADGAFAQQSTDQTLEKIEVTGSHILQTEKESAASVQVITAEDIQRTGQPTVSDLLRTISANAGNTYNESFSNSFAPGAASISLRGLSPKNTLVLINGARVANYGFAQNLQDTFVDINAIPANAVERIEIKKDGASAVYGSEAIAGVVNIILKNSYEGATAGASIDIPTEGGYTEHTVNALWGHGDLATDKYNLMVAANYYKNTELDSDHRSWASQQDYQNVGGDTGLLNGATFRTTPRQAMPGCGTTLTGSPTVGSTVGYPYGGSNVYCLYNPASYLPLRPASEREQIVANGTAQLAPTVTAFGDVLYSHTKTNSTFTPGAVSPSSTLYNAATGINGFNGSFPAGSPFLNGNPGPVGINYTFFAVGPRATEVTTDFYRVMAGLKGTFAAWDWKATAGFSQSKDKDNNSNAIYAPALATDLAYTGPIANAPYNFFNPAATPAGVAALRTSFADESTSQLSFVDASLSSEILQLPAGALSFAVGTEFRHESINYPPASAIDAGTILSRGQTSIDGARNEYAFYTELIVPVVKTLTANLAGRYDHYSDFGSATSPKIGLEFRPVEQILARASASKGFRAPSLPEIAKSSATYFSAGCDTYFNPPNCTSFTGVNVANPNLKPERSTSLNLGLVFSPVPAFSANVDWYRIIDHDLVETNSVGSVLANPNSPQIVRDPTTHNIIYVNTPYANLTALDTSGIDFGFNLKGDTAAGKTTLDVQFTYIAHYLQAPGAGQPYLENAGNNDLNINFNSGGAIPRLRGTVGVNFDQTAWSERVAYNYISGYDQEGVVLGALPGSQTRVGDYGTYDLYAEYRGIKNLKIYGAINNVLNTAPPIDVFQAFYLGVPFDFTLYDARDRVVRIGVEYKFK